MNSPSTSLLERTQTSLSLAENPASTALVPAGSGQPVAPGTAPAMQPAPFDLHFPAGPLIPSQTAAPRKKRNGKVAHLPKPEREMVNLMLRNNLPYYSIEDALYERGFQVSQRNISNWKTRGGYTEWCAAQAQALELRLFQDNLTDFLRRHDAAELPEVGLQSAATNLSALLLRPDLMRELLAEPEKYSKLIELQCRLAREIQALQKNRDDMATQVADNPERLKRQHQKAVEDIRKLFSSDRHPEQGHLVPNRNFIPKQIDPVTPFTVAERESARKFDSLFEPKPRNRDSKTRQAASAPEPQAQQSNPKENAPTDAQPTQP